MCTAVISGVLCNTMMVYFPIGGNNHFIYVFIYIVLDVNAGVLINRSNNTH